MSGKLRLICYMNVYAKGLKILIFVVLSFVGMKELRYVYSGLSYMGKRF